jgi:hypothetical protein
MASSRYPPTVCAVPKGRNHCYKQIKSRSPFATPIEKCHIHSAYDGNLAVNIHGRTGNNAITLKHSGYVVCGFNERMLFLSACKLRSHVRPVHRRIPKTAA